MKKTNLNNYYVADGFVDSYGKINMINQDKSNV